MDILSDAVAAIRTGRPRSVRTEGRAPWGMSIRPTIGACFHVVLGGECWLLTPGEPDVLLRTGDVVFLKTGRDHGLADDPGTPLVPADDIGVEEAVGSPVGLIQMSGDGVLTTLLCGAYQLDTGRTHPLLRNLPDIIRISADRSRHPALHAAIEMLGLEMASGAPGMIGAIPALIDVLLIYVLRAWLDEQSHGSAAEWADALMDPTVSAALHSMHENPGRPWTVVELARLGGMSRAAFSRRFTRLVGEPPLTYLTRWRMTSACRMLRESEISLCAVAERVGYTSEFAFAKAFKREFGTAPGQYRRTVRVLDRDGLPRASSIFG